MNRLEAEEIDGPITEELGVFFRSLGAVSFSRPDAARHLFQYAGDARVVCAAASAGVIFFADNTGWSQFLIRPAAILHSIRPK